MKWNLKEYANLIVKLSSNKKKLKSISENAKKFAKENFNPKEYINLKLKIYINL